MSEQQDHGEECDQCTNHGTEVSLTEGRYGLRAVLCPEHRDKMIEHFRSLRERST